MTAEATGTLIQRARQRKRLTQQELADALDVSRSAVVNWETGKHFPLRYVGAIEELLEIAIPAPEPDEIPA
jgi:transcriptional regulator with XRE-family HTH domain